MGLCSFKINAPNGSYSNKKSCLSSSVIDCFSFLFLSGLCCSVERERECISESLLYSSTRCLPYRRVLTWQSYACFLVWSTMTSGRLRRKTPTTSHFCFSDLLSWHSQLHIQPRINFCRFSFLCTFSNSTGMHLYFNCGWSACLHPLYIRKSL